MAGIRYNLRQFHLYPGINMDYQL
ncbi:cupin superfamily protein, partial [Yersinia pestis PY-89]